MKIFSAPQIKEWDRYTIEHNSMSSVLLMERAASACSEWIADATSRNKTILIFCGKGNNGGDGLSIARHLITMGYQVAVFIPQINTEGTPDFEVNLKRLYEYTNRIKFLETEDDLPEIDHNCIVVDALLGIGLKKEITGIYQIILQHILKAKLLTIAIDMPSGLLADEASESIIIKADVTLTFQCYKLSLMLAENEKYFGKVIVLPIGLDQHFEKLNDSSYQVTTSKTIGNIFKPRSEFSHKGTFGHAGIIAGSYGMMGAATLCTKACVRSGVGKVTAITCKDGYAIMQTSVREAMCITSGRYHIKELEDLQNYSAIGIGPGLGKRVNKKIFQQLFKEYNKALVIDADGLNLIAQHEDLKAAIPKETILTPHPKEFENLFGKCDNDFERLKLAINTCVIHGIYIILKGHHTAVITPGGIVNFNNTGNSGMAKGGSGDVLTGILTGLLAQGYTQEEACLLGVYLHGKAGDIAAEKLSKESMTPSDIIDCLGEAFIKIKNL